MSGDDLLLWAATATDPARGRFPNQDSAFVGRRLLALADGMGGPVAGDLASALTIDAVRELDDSTAAATAEQEGENLSDASYRANRRLANRISSEPRLSGMGTTLTACVLTGSELIFGHVGDSRGYLYRARAGGSAEDGLTQVTKDHSFVQMLVDEGQITADEALSHPHRAWIMRALDGRDDHETDTFAVDVRDGDRVLLCSDGLSDFVPAATIARLLASADTPQQAAHDLVEAAVASTGRDNITTVVGFVVARGRADTAAMAATPAPPVLVGAAAALTDTASGELTQSRETDAPLLLPDDVAEARAGEEERVVDADGSERARYALRPPSRMVWFRRTAILAVVLAVLATVGLVGYRWTQTQYYLGPVDSSETSEIAIYQGVPEAVGRLNLSTEVDRVGVTLNQLPTYQREQIRKTVAAKSREEADDIASQLRTIAQRCALQAKPGVTSSDIPAECEGVTP